MLEWRQVLWKEVAIVYVRRRSLGTEMRVFESHPNAAEFKGYHWIDLQYKQIKLDSTSFNICKVLELPCGGQECLK